MAFLEETMKEEQLQPMMVLTTCFSVIRDTRIERNKLYPLQEVIVITRRNGVSVQDSRAGATTEGGLPVFVKSGLFRYFAPRNDGHTLRGFGQTCPVAVA
jgi:hypothetical protein